MKRIITFAFFTLLTALAQPLKAGNAETFKITGTECQQIDGFGASDAWSMWKAEWWGDSLCNRIADWLFSQEVDEQGNPKGIGLSIWRYNAGAGSASQGQDAKINRDTRTEFYDKQKGQRQFLKMAKQRGVPTILAFFNTPPVTMTINGLGTNTGRGGSMNLRDDAYDDFATYAADMIETIGREDGVAIDYLCPVNEPDGSWNWQGPKQEGTPATNREVARIAREMSKEFSGRGLKTRIMVNESSDYRCMLGIHDTDWQRGNEIECFWNPDSADTYVGDLPNVARIMAGHSYWTNTPVLRPGDKGYKNKGLYGYRRRIREAFEKKDVKFWMSELCIMQNDTEIGGGTPYDFTMKTALYVARVMHYDLTVAWASSWQWWRALGGNYRDGLLKEEWMRHEGGRKTTVRDSKLLWAVGNYSRFVRPGAVRLEVEGGNRDPYGVMVSAYRNSNGSIVAVAINYSEKEQIISIQGVSDKSEYTLFRTSDIEGENLKLIGRGNKKDISLIPRSITSIVFK